MATMLHEYRYQNLNRFCWSVGNKPGENFLLLIFTTIIAFKCVFDADLMDILQK